MCRRRAPLRCFILGPFRVRLRSDIVFFSRSGIAADSCPAVSRCKVISLQQGRSILASRKILKPPAPPVDGADGVINYLVLLGIISDDGNIIEYLPTRMSWDEKSDIFHCSSTGLVSVCGAFEIADPKTRKLPTKVALISLLNLTRWTSTALIMPSCCR